MSISEQDVITKIRAGDIDSFESIYLDLRPKLYAFCRKYVDDIELAKDIVQDVFFCFWEKRFLLQINTSINAYLFQMLHNRCLNHLRSEKVRLSYQNSIELKFKETELNYFDELQESHVSIYFKDIEEIFKRSIDSLPESCKKIFLLSRVDGIDNKTIAETLNLSIRTIEHQNYRALKILKEQLKDYLPLFLFLLSH
ncbi:MAG: RNA polymerase sigma-70 factor [Bacteroidetes bacterium]|nr:RNA polymerase sigma-70 factor [Bacteroidota bacterium]